MISVPLKMTYTNYRGETSVRNVTPKTLRFGTTEWHPKDCWLLMAWDWDKEGMREFALADCDFTKGDET